MLVFLSLLGASLLPSELISLASPLYVELLMGPLVFILYGALSMIVALFFCLPYSDGKPEVKEAGGLGHLICVGGGDSEAVRDRTKSIEVFVRWSRRSIRQSCRCY